MINLIWIIVSVVVMDIIVSRVLTHKVNKQLINKGYPNEEYSDIKWVVNNGEVGIVIIYPMNKKVKYLSYPDLIEQDYINAVVNKTLKHKGSFGRAWIASKF